MKLKDLLTTRTNKITKQFFWHPKKKKIKSLGLTEDALLNINIDNLIGGKN